jgi:hypothetical protein
MMVDRRSVNPSELVIGLAEGRDVCVSRAHDADIQQPYHDLHACTHG